MNLTAELRLWWPHCPHEIEAWFRTTDIGGPAQGEERTDTYLFDPEQDEIGIKVRDRDQGAGAQVKLLVARLGTFDGQPIELWVKSLSKALSLSDLPNLDVRKSRSLKQFRADGSAAPANDKPDLGCQVEFAEIWCEGESRQWWTFSFEASGTLETVEGILKRTLKEVVPRLPGDEFAEGVAGGYPLWLSTIRSSRLK